MRLLKAEQVPRPSSKRNYLLETTKLLEMTPETMRLLNAMLLLKKTRPHLDIQRQGPQMMQHHEMLC